MREIKFRAWDKEIKIMMEPNYFGIDEYITPQGGVVEEETHSGIGFSDMYMVDISDKRVLMQYTGLKDCNGVEIYEGDIVEYNDFNSLRTGGQAEDKIIVGKVVFSCGMWMVEENNCGHDLYEGVVNDEELEVIGNIYENPELLGDMQ